MNCRVCEQSQEPRNVMEQGCNVQCAPETTCVSILPPASVYPAYCGDTCCSSRADLCPRPLSIDLWPDSLHGQRRLAALAVAAGRLGELVSLSSRLAPCPRQGGPSPAGSRGRFPGQLGLATAPVTHCSLKDTPKLNGFNDSHLLGS